MFKSMILLAGGQYPAKLLLPPPYPALAPVPAVDGRDELTRQRYAEKSCGDGDVRQMIVVVALDGS